MSSDTSRSVIVKKFGGYEALSVGEFPLAPLDNNIEIEIEYGGLNFADLYTRQGLMHDKKLPFVLGIECAGIVKTVDCDDSNLKVGQKVLCYDYKGGLFRDTIRVPKEQCFQLPDELDLEVGAAIFVNYLTAYFSILQLGNLKKNETVLILSCAGGVGCAATQLAKTIPDVKIFGTGSPHKEAEAKKNGVHTFIPNETFQNDVKTSCPSGFDLILTNQSGPIFKFLTDLLKPLGRIVVIGANNLIQNEKKLSKLSLLKAWWNTSNISMHTLIMNNQMVSGLHLGTLLENDREKIVDALNHIFNLVKDGKLKPIIHSKWPLSKIVDATKELAERKNVGKILINMKEDS